MTYLKTYYYGDEAGPDPIRGALRAITGRTPPKWLKGYSTNFGTDAQRIALQDWVNEKPRPFWSTGIGILDAADTLVDEAVANANIPPPEYWTEERKAELLKRATKKAKRK